MKKIVLFSFILASIHVNGQSLVDSLSNPGFSLTDSIGPALANLAAERSAVPRVLDKQIEAGRYQWQATKFNWFNNLRASFNLNEANLKSKPDPTPGVINTGTFYPRYNFNLVVPIGDFFTNGIQSKRARAQYQELQVEKELEVNNLMGQVLVSYENYKMKKYLLAIQETIIQDELIAFAKVEDQFKNGAVTLEVFTNSSKRFNDEISRRVTYMHDANVSKYQLETLIGMKLEDALRVISGQQPAPSR